MHYTGTLVTINPVFSAELGKYIHMNVYAIFT